jgi:molybdenum cofactor biosynthesis enzyme MoaA
VLVFVYGQRTDRRKRRVLMGKKDVFHNIRAGFIVDGEPVLIDVMVTNREEADKTVEFFQNLEEVGFLQLKAIVPMDFEQIKAKVGEAFDEAMSRSSVDLRDMVSANTVAA